MNSLSKRLSVIKALVPDGARACDVGTDHGYLAIELIKSGKCKSVIASDINVLPLENARKNIAKSGAFGIELRLSDGLAQIKKDEIDTVIIAGMGGEVISGIIERGSNILKDTAIKIILQPTTSPEILREYLFSNMYEIVKEIPIAENGKLYSVMLVSFCGQKTQYSEYQKYIGLITPETNDGRLYIEKQYNRCKKCFKALTNIPEKYSEYIKNKIVCEQIEEYIKSF